MLGGVMVTIPGATTPVPSVVFTTGSMKTRVLAAIRMSFARNMAGLSDWNRFQFLHRQRLHPRSIFYALLVNLPERQIFSHEVIQLRMPTWSMPLLDDTGMATVSHLPPHRTAA